MGGFDSLSPHFSRTHLGHKNSPITFCGHFRSKTLYYSTWEKEKRHEEAYMRTKIMILGLIFLILIACEKGIENPYSPELPSPSNPNNPGSLYIYYDIDVTMGIALSDATPFPGEQGYMIFYPIVAGKSVQNSSVPPLTITDKKPSDSFNRIITVKLDSQFNDGSPMTRWGKNANWQLFQAGISASGWLANAQLQCWLQLIPVSTGIRIEPPEQQITFTGWTIGESKAVYFTIIKE